MAAVAVTAGESRQQLRRPKTPSGGGLGDAKRTQILFLVTVPLLLSWILNKFCLLWFSFV